MFGIEKLLRYMSEDREKLSRTIMELTIRTKIQSKEIEQLTKMAMHDELTDLPNKRLFMNRLENKLVEYNKHGRPKDRCVVLYVDLNNFKTINDTLGHATGDETLKAVGQRLRSCVRRDDTVARLSGDEFAVLLSGKVSATKVVARMVKQFPIQGLQLRDGRHVQVGISIGAIRFNKNTMDNAEELMNSSDRAMYLAKLKCRGSGMISGHSWTGNTKAPS